MTDKESSGPQLATLSRRQFLRALGTVPAVYYVTAGGIFAEQRTTSNNAPADPRNGYYLNKTGITPLVSVQLDKDGPAIWCKLNFMNPSGSVKDVIATYMLEKASDAGEIKAGGSVVEASSGNTSIALALACAQRGLNFTSVMAEGVSEERIINVRAYGGRVELVSRKAGIGGAMQRANEISKEKGAFYTRQFENPNNPASYELKTGPEILEQIPGGTVDAIVAGVGTGGTIVGLYRAFARINESIIPVVARPVTGESSDDGPRSTYSHRIPGVAGGVSQIYRDAILPGKRIVDVNAEFAIQTGRRLIERGFPVGPSSGLNYAAAAMAASFLPKTARIVTVFPDRMDRYYSTDYLKDLR